MSNATHIVQHKRVPKPNSRYLSEDNETPPIKVSRKLKSPRKAAGKLSAPKKTTKNGKPLQPSKRKYVLKATGGRKSKIEGWGEQKPSVRASTSEKAVNEPSNNVVPVISTCKEHERKRNPRKPKKYVIDCTDVDFLDVNDVVRIIRTSALPLNSIYSLYFSSIMYAATLKLMKRKTTLEANYNFLWMAKNWR